MIKQLKRLPELLILYLLFIVVFYLGVAAGWQSANSNEPKQTFTLRKVGE